ncbi:tyrosine decarboxylase MfnA [Candidatus Alkanophaga liquidiphilum]|nr:MAG: tyrosine decarboxylase MfnA [Candidatus Alkanophagales archaeon]
MEERGLSAEEVELLLEEKKRKDLRYERIFSSMCTYPHEIAIRAHMKFIEANLGDYGLFPGTKEMESEVVRMLGSLLGKEDAVGYVTTGGTESNIQAIRAARNLKRKELGNATFNIVVPESAHFSFDKIADLLSLEVRKARLDDELRVDVGAVGELTDKRTVAIVGIAGTTEFGQIDPIEELAELALEKSVFLHVDAAFGGFVIPFLERRYKFDFSVEGVSAISIDPHKMGMSTIPAGCLLFRRREHLEALAVETPYLTTKAQYSLVGTRSGAAAAATFAVLKLLGREGLRKVVGECMRLTKLIVEGARKLGVEPVIEPVMNVIALKVENVELVAERLREWGWRVSTTKKPKALRLVIMPHVTEEAAEQFLVDFAGALGLS